MYDVKFSSQAAKFFKKLPFDVQERIRLKFKEIALTENPFRFFEHYEGDYHKLRIGDYRVLMDIDQTRKIIFVRVFDKRGRIYK
ncbi:MAG: type II toxin-antitoxin system RelE/ParE family toxin [Nanoarchaeota archaeon]